MLFIKNIIFIISTPSRLYPIGKGALKWISKMFLLPPPIYICDLQSYPLSPISEYFTPSFDYYLTIPEDGDLLSLLWKSISTFSLISCEIPINKPERLNAIFMQSTEKGSQSVPLGLGGSLQNQSAAANEFPFCAFQRTSLRDLNESVQANS